LLGNHPVSDVGWHVIGYDGVMQQLPLVRRRRSFVKGYR
jgi:hypothetical protein